MGYDRRDGTGRGGRREKKEGAGKFGDGTKPEHAYKRKDQDTVEAVEGATAEEAKVDAREEKKHEPEEEEIIIGVSFDDFFKDKAETKVKVGRNAGGIEKNIKTVGND